MVETSKKYENEIDLFEIIKLLWREKLKIILIIFLAFLVGIYLNSRESESFKISVPLQSAKSSNFINLISLNDILSENDRSLLINSENFFKLFERELNDLDSVVDILRTNEFVQRRISDLDEKSVNQALTRYARSFKLSKTPKAEMVLGDQIQRKFSFVWPNTDEGVKITEEVIIQSLENVKLAVINNVTQLAQSIDFKIERRLNELDVELSLIKKNELDKIKKRIVYLTEQAEIAKTLGIETNSLNASALSQSESNSGMGNGSSEKFNNNFDTAPFYLRGYTAIYKEIELLKSRSEEDLLLMSEGFLNLKAKIQYNKNSLVSSHLLLALKTFENSNPSEFIVYSFAVANFESMKKPLITILYSLIIGGIVGIIYVIVSSSFFNSRKDI
tara:strand:- start:3642 stop:4808 length:1167 start_codon:yes stop_codon:yes gene_type:complete